MSGKPAGGMNGARIATIMVKELRQVSRDPATLGMLLVVPLFLLLMFGFAINLDTKHIQLAVLDYDKTQYSREFLQSFLHSEYFDLKLVLDREDQIDRLLDTGQVLVAMVIPRDFGRDAANGNRVEVQAIVDGSNGTTAATAIGYVQAVAADYSQRAFVRSLERAGVTGMKTTIDFQPRVLFNPELRSANFLIPGLIVLILMMTAVLSTTLSIVREKERGTMEQIAVSPVRPFELILGKTVPYLVISLVAAAAILATSRILFAVTVKGSWLDMSVVTLVFLFGCLAFGVLLSTVSDSQQVAFLLSSLLTLLPTFILSGFVFPFRNMPWIIQAFSYLLPGRYYLAALRAIMVKGVGFWAFSDQVLALVVFALVAGGLSVLRLRRQSR
jgi:ABC-2 type transport system permease protein